MGLVPMDVRGCNQQERGLASDCWRETRRSRSEQCCWVGEVKRSRGTRVGTTRWGTKSCKEVLILSGTRTVFARGPCLLPSFNYFSAVS
jgi:hypothetical protein